MSGMFTLPGLIDCHVHFREPGLEHKGDMETESRAARAGGVFTVCDMPNTVPPTTTVKAFEDKVRRAERITDVDIRFFFGITRFAHLEEFIKLKNRRCCGIKLYLDHSTGNQKVDANVTENVFRICAELDVPLVAHCEDSETNEHDPSRPPESEVKSVEFALSLASKFKTPFHVAHLSTVGGLGLVRQAKRDGSRVSCEVTPHHLFLTIDDFERLGALAKMNPPLRTKENQEALWEGINDGTIDCVSTDHAPHTLEEKQCGSPTRGRLDSPAGVPGVETMLPLLLTRLSPEKITELCFDNPNQIFRLGKTKEEHRLQVDFDEEWVIHGRDLHGKCKWTPFEGWRVRSKVML